MSTKCENQHNFPALLRQSFKLLTLENALHRKFARWKLLIAFYPPLQTATPQTPGPTPK